MNLKRIALLTLLLTLVPWHVVHAVTRVDTATTTSARFAGGVSLYQASLAGTLALVTQIGPNFYNATSLIAQGKQGGFESQVFWHLYKTDGFSFALGLGATADIIRENPTYEQAVLYASATPGFALTYRISDEIIIHGAMLYLTPAETDRRIRAYIVLSFPIKQ